MLDKIRILPVLIFVCSFMLFVRVDHIWAESKDIAQKTEAKPAETKPADAKAAESKPADAKPGEAKPGESKPGEAKAEAPAATSTEADAAKTADKNVDPLLFNDSELDILQSLSARRTQLDERERQIEQKEGLLQITEQRVDQKVEELKKLKMEIESTKKDVEKMTSGFDEKEKQRYAALVKTYESMKPKEAARIFDQMDMPVLVSIIGQMKEAKMAPILASMDPSKAKGVTMELARKNTMPEFGDSKPTDKGVPPPAPEQKTDQTKPH